MQSKEQPSDFILFIFPRSDPWRGLSSLPQIFEGRRANLRNDTVAERLLVTPGWQVRLPRIREVRSPVLGHTACK